MILDDLSAVIRDRKDHPREGSYVSSLFGGGKNEILKKVGEEAIEVIIAANTGDRKNLVHELADLWFHSLVLAEGEGISCSEILRELEGRRK